MHLTAVLLAGFAALSIANPLPSIPPHGLEPVLDVSVVARDLDISELNIQNATLDKRASGYTQMYQNMAFPTKSNNFWIVSEIVTETFTALLPNNMVRDASYSIEAALYHARPVGYFLDDNWNVRTGIVTLADGISVSFRFSCENSHGALSKFDYIARVATGCALEYMTNMFQSWIGVNLVDINSGSVVGTIILQVLRPN